MSPLPRSGDSGAWCKGDSPMSRRWAHPISRGPPPECLSRRVRRPVVRGSVMSSEPKCGEEPRFRRHLHLPPADLDTPAPPSSYGEPHSHVAQKRFRPRCRAPVGHDCWSVVLSPRFSVRVSSLTIGCTDTPSHHRPNSICPSSGKYRMQDDLYNAGDLPVLKCAGVALCIRLGNVACSA
jgi:hypothetical protein